MEGMLKSDALTGQNRFDNRWVVPGLGRSMGKYMLELGAGANYNQPQKRGN
ncbi:MAG: hypothetical protein KatS3mg032_1195 [Cyclobacteriaceae bacterium]|nr:MAG: hypothetical protein KatS3mg032_1195 [Cyclobacteriaceae bacterium]